MLEVDDRGTQDESMSELKQEIEELKNKLQEEKEKTNALVIQLNEMKQQLVNLTTRCGNFEKKSFSLNRFKNDKSMGLPLYRRALLPKTIKTALLSALSFFYGLQVM